uniref:Putative mariner mos1 transposase n=1 Tax=Anopheles braziliensis TaxID=58242 RepID=A0A2M3Z1E7_9DIPT
MATFTPKFSDVRTSLIFCFQLKKTVVEAHQMLVEAYGNHALYMTQCRLWYKKFQRGDFDVSSEGHGRPSKKFEDADLKPLLEEDDDQTQKQLAEQLNVDQSTVSRRLKAMGMILKLGRTVPHKLTKRQQENRKTTCQILHNRYKKKAFLHRNITGDEKWIYFENPKRKRSYVKRTEQPQMTARPNRFGKKAMLCVFRNQAGVIWWNLLNHEETVTSERYNQQLIDLDRELCKNRPEYRRRQLKPILLDDNAPPHRGKPAKDIVQSLNWEQLPHAAYSPDLTPSDYHLFASLGHALAKQRFDSYENVKKRMGEWFNSKDQLFFWQGIHKLPER